MDNFSFDTPDVEQGGGGSFIQQLPIILWQRKWWIIVPTVLGIIGASSGHFSYSTGLPIKCNHAGRITAIAE